MGNRQRQEQGRNTGSLHCAADDETVLCSGRDDVLYWRRSGIAKKLGRS